jgi:hypothetical protein
MPSRADRDDRAKYEHEQLRDVVDEIGGEHFGLLVRGSRLSVPLCSEPIIGRKRTQPVENGPSEIRTRRSLGRLGPVGVLRLARKKRLLGVGNRLRVAGLAGKSREKSGVSDRMVVFGDIDLPSGDFGFRILTESLLHGVVEAKGIGRQGLRLNGRRRKQRSRKKARAEKKTYEGTHVRGKRRCRDTGQIVMRET